MMQEPTSNDQADQQQPQVDPELLAIQKEAGAELLDGDPEISSLIYDKGSYAFYKSVEAAAEAKKQRLAPLAPLPDETPTTQLPVSMPAREAWKVTLHKNK